MERETAMKILKELHDNSLFSNRIALETLIPELADSNDERIRKALLEMVHDTTGDELWVDYNVHKEEALAWLEKQESVREVVERCKNSWYNEGKIAGMAEGLTNDEKYQQGWHDALEKQCQTFTKKDVDDAYLKGVCDAKHELEKQGEQKPTVVDFNAKDWYVSKVDGKLHNIYQSVDKIEQKPTSDTKYEVKAGGSLSANGQPFDYEHATITQKDFAPINVTDEGIVEAIKNTSVLDMIEQKQEWSEEDENYLQSAENACEYQYGKNTSTILWLKSLKNRVQHQEWSEEDEVELDNAIYACLNFYGKDSDTADWLKSIKDRIGG